MILSRVSLQGFRNYKKAIINLKKKTLIIGANDVGKTNLIWGIRLLLDRGLSDYELEPKDSDFYAFEETNEFKIILRFAEVTDDCVVSKMKEKISDTHDLLIAYHGFRDPVTKAKSYKLYAGPSKDLLEEIEDRYYRRVLNLKYISSRRDFHHYINREKSYLFETAKANRTEEEALADEKLYGEIQTALKAVDEKVPKLNFISSATNTINDELEKLSLHHQKQKVVFDATTSVADGFINNVSISSKSNNQNILIGGDGRLNQIYLALWSSRNELTQDNMKEVTIFCIEEPEAHLHPHQQRKLADYLNASLTGQVLITSHSSQIASEFSPNSIVKLYNFKGATKAASNGCSEIIDGAFTDFGYRLSVIPSEAFFADVVLLVEGPSELIFYKTLAHQIDVDLDRLNISILMVDGIGFKTFIKILDSLNIRWVLRTDNDIFKIPRKNAYRFAGIHRCIDYYNRFLSNDADTDALIAKHGPNVTGFPTKEPAQINIDSAEQLIEEFASYNMYLSEKDLENDIFNSDLKEDLNDYFSEYLEEEIVGLMQENKATFMYKFLKAKKDSLKKLKGHDLAEPIIACAKVIQEIQDEAN